METKIISFYHNSSQTDVPEDKRRNTCGQYRDETLRTLKTGASESDTCSRMIKLTSSLLGHSL